MLYVLKVVKPREITITKEENENKWLYGLSKTKTPAENQVCKYNDCYYICRDLDTLKIFAKRMKENWLQEAKANLKMIEELKIKSCRK